MPADLGDYAPLGRDDAAEPRDPDAGDAGDAADLGPRARSRRSRRGTGGGGGGGGSSSGRGRVGDDGRGAFEPARRRVRSVSPGERGRLDSRAARFGRAGDGHAGDGDGGGGGAGSGEVAGDRSPSRRPRRHRSQSRERESRRARRPSRSRSRSRSPRRSPRRSRKRMRSPAWSRRRSPRSRSPGLRSRSPASRSRSRSRSRSQSRSRSRSPRRPGRRGGGGRGGDDRRGRSRSWSRSRSRSHSRSRSRSRSPPRRGRKRRRGGRDRRDGRDPRVDLPPLEPGDTVARFERALRHVLSRRPMPFMCCLVVEQMQAEDRDFHIARTRWASFMDLCDDMVRDGVLTLDGERGRRKVVASPLAPLSGGLTHAVGWGGGRGGGSHDRGPGWDGGMEGGEEAEAEGPLPDLLQGHDDEYVFDLFVEALKHLATPGPYCRALPFRASALAAHMSHLNWDWRQKSPRWTGRFRALCERMQEEGHLSVSVAANELMVVDSKYFDRQGLTLSGIRAASAVASGVAPRLPPPEHGGGPRPSGPGGRLLPRPRSPRGADEEVLDAVWSAVKSVGRRRSTPFVASIVSDEVRKVHRGWSLRGTSFRSFIAVMEVLEGEGKLVLRRKGFDIFCVEIYDGRPGGEPGRGRSRGGDRKDSDRQGSSRRGDDRRSDDRRAEERRRENGACGAEEGDDTPGRGARTDWGETNDAVMEDRGSGEPGPPESRPSSPGAALSGPKPHSESPEAASEEANDENVVQPPVQTGDAGKPAGEPSAGAPSAGAPSAASSAVDDAQDEPKVGEARVGDDPAPTDLPGAGVQ